MSKKYDLVVIGWGKGGKTLAGMAASKGLKVAIIEKDSKMYGGTCINVACLPTKSLSYSSEILEKISKLGIKRDYNLNNEIFKKAMEEKDIMVSNLNKRNYTLLAEKENVDVYDGLATFISNREIKVNDEILTAENIIINTGAKSRNLNIKGSDNSNILTSNEILNLKELPKKMLVIGAGFIGLEFANYFNNFGTEVTIFQNDANFLMNEDEDVREYIKEHLIKKGIKLELNIDILEFLGKDEVEVKYIKDNEEKIEKFDKVLVAIGRVPNIEGLGLENTDIEISERNEIKVNEYLETNVKNVWALGDVKGGAQFTYISLDDSRIIASQIFENKKNRSILDRKFIPTTSFISPSYSKTGYSERELNEKGIKYSKKYLLTQFIPKAHVIREKEGFIKILISENDEILGAQIMNDASYEMINLLTLAINEKIKYQSLRDMIYTHPTMSEILNDLLK